MTTALSHDAFKAWIGRSECHDEVISARPLIGLSACLDRDDLPPRDGDDVPPGWHWLYFLPTYKTSDCGEDGHARLGTSLPPIPLPRRMWAGGRLSFHYPLRIGDRARKVSTIKDVTIKSGRSGLLAFVTVEHEIFGAEGLAIVEEHDIVYREAGGTPGVEPPPAPTRAKFFRSVEPTPLLLFRYSALTYNGHRIHYDRGFCAKEGYPGLVVHGPLTATLLLDLVRDSCPSRTIASFQFRAVSPLFDTDNYSVNGKPVRDGVELWAASHTGALAMSAEARFA